MGFGTDHTPDATPTVTLAKVYEKQGLLDRAAEVYRRLIALEPERTELGEALRDLERRLDRERPEPLESGTQTVLSRLERWKEGIHGRKRARDPQPGKGKRILVIHGPKADIVGQAEPFSSDDMTLEQIDGEIKEIARTCDMVADTFQSDDEGELAQKIGDASEGYDVVIINPAGYAQTGTAIRDALSKLDIPIVEVHLSNTHGQGFAGQKSLIADIATAQLAGFGKEGYMMAVRASANMTRKA
jgi:3-dehydroquinate dehydratase-2